MKSSLSVLRNRQTDTAAFRDASAVVCRELVQKVHERMSEQRTLSEHVVLAIILRSAFAFLGAAIHEFPQAPVAVMGMKRDEQTLTPHWYYENLPPISKESAFLILDPMLATGGSAEAAIKRLAEHGADLQKMYFVGVIGAPEGFSRIAKLLPKDHIVLGALDEKLDEHGMIVPGLGDFGDRYFGHAGQARVDT